MRTIYRSNGTATPSVIEIDDDRNEERPGNVRAFWVEGSHKRIKNAVREVQRLYPGEPVYRAGSGRKLA